MRKRTLVMSATVIMAMLIAFMTPSFAATTDGDVAPFGSRDGIVDVGDALVALRFALVLETPSQDDMIHGDIAPLTDDNVPNPDGFITVGDALVILRKALGLINWPLSEFWEGEGISFTVSGDPPHVTEFSVSYRVKGVGTKCSLDYPACAVISSQPGFPIANNSFAGTSEGFLGGDSLIINGTFLDSQNAEIVVSWEGYNSICDAEYSGSDTYTAKNQ